MTSKQFENITGKVLVRTDWTQHYDLTVLRVKPCDDNEKLEWSEVLQLRTDGRVDRVDNDGGYHLRMAIFAR